MTSNRFRTSLGIVLVALAFSNLLTIVVLCSDYLHLDSPTREADDNLSRYKSRSPEALEINRASRESGRSSYKITKKIEDVFAHEYHAAIPVFPNFASPNRPMTLRASETRTHKMLSLVLDQSNPQPEDLANTTDIQISPEIRLLVNEVFQNDTLKMFLFVYNNITYEPYYGSVKGALHTLAEKRGNDIDQASLLLALFRAAGIPSRYLESNMTLTPEQAMNWVGVNCSEAAYEVFWKNGVPAYAEQNASGDITSIEILHFWTEAWLDETWVPMDPSFKQYKYYSGIDFDPIVGFNVDEYVEGLMDSGEIGGTWPDWYATGINETFMEQEDDMYLGNVRDFLLNNLDLSLRDILGGKTIVKAVDYTFNISMTEPNVYSTLPSNYRDYVKFMVPHYYSGGQYHYTETGIMYNVSMPEIAGKRITLSANPTNQAIWDIVNSSGGVYNVYRTYAYYDPELAIDGDVVDKGVGSAWMLGEYIPVEIRFSGPAWPKPYYSVTNWFAVGSYSALVLDDGTSGAVLQRHALALNETLNNWIENPVRKDDVVGAAIHLMGLSYFMRLKMQCDLFSKQFNVAYQGHVSEALVSLDLQPVGNKVKFSGMHIDVGLWWLGATSKFANSLDTRNFWTACNVMASSYEHSLFEHFLDVPSVSTETILRTANQRGMKVYLINGTNEHVIDLLDTRDNVKDYLHEKVQAGYTIIVPASDISTSVLVVNASQTYTDTHNYATYRGIGFKIINVTTGGCREIIWGVLQFGNLHESTNPRILGNGIFGGQTSSLKQFNLNQDPWAINARALADALPDWLDLTKLPLNFIEPWGSAAASALDYTEIYYNGALILQTDHSAESISPTAQKIAHLLGEGGADILTCALGKLIVGGFVIAAITAIPSGGSSLMAYGYLILALESNLVLKDFNINLKRTVHRHIRNELCPQGMLSPPPPFEGDDPATPVHLTVISPKGLHTGFNISTADEENWGGIYQIESSWYSGYGNETHGDPQTIIVADPTPGIYTVIHTGTTFASSYNFHVGMTYGGQLQEFDQGTFDIDPSDMWISKFVVVSNPNGTLSIPAHNIAVAILTTSKTVIGQGYPISINTTVENQGFHAETFNVTVYADQSTTVIGDEITIETRNVTLASGGSTVITFTWNTTGVAYGNYTMSALADTVELEFYTADNTYVNGNALVTILGDVDGDGKIDSSDLFHMARTYGSTPGLSNWNPNCDIKEDDKIDVFDLFNLGKGYGENAQTIAKLTTSMWADRYSSCAPDGSRILYTAWANCWSGTPGIMNADDELLISAACAYRFMPFLDTRFFDYFLDTSPLEMSISHLRARISMVFQNSLFIHKEIKLLLTHTKSGSTLEGAMKVELLKLILEAST